ncbi:TetR/AcrR family transcriptional regulator [Dongia rigui]|uniref:TetR/AcrR family transcriptional regulator n=1 Tax=Dongia rigui TaxID=940149 RepID=A0ABU5DTN4_9PROT|nr:TetR/AcrR family transcriptional regulator [Dongia rigui]MDY0870670.1 TetR/AcrR family transcriptional regulator [Dongia rigui]
MSKVFTFSLQGADLSTRIPKAKAAMRKEPSQSRSKATVEAIIEAATRILSVEGWAGFNTNKVAEAAGVSIGSLYQYFPSKLSLVEAIRRRHIEDCLGVMKRAGKSGRPLAQFVADLVRDLIAVHSLHPGLHRVLLDDAPSADAFRDPHDAFEVDYLASYTAVVRHYRQGKTGSSDEAVAMTLSDAIDGVIHNAARRGTLQNPEVGAELVRLVTSYLAAE